MSGVEVKAAERVFLLTEADALSLEQDGYLSAVLERSGVTDPALEQLAGAALVREAHLRVLETGNTGRFLAAFLVEQGQEWSEPRARKLAGELSRLRSSEDRATLHDLLGGLILGFFGSGRSWQRSGPSSSPSPAIDPDENSALAAASTMATGSP